MEVEYSQLCTEFNTVSDSEYAPFEYLCDKVKQIGSEKKN